MKAILPHSFYIFASQFTLESMLNQISFLSYHIFLSLQDFILKKQNIFAFLPFYYKKIIRSC